MNIDLDVSIVIPTYNRFKLLLTVLPSYLKQKYVSEILIIDDGSDLNLYEIGKNFDIIDENFIKVIRHTRSMGSCASRNTGIYAAKSNWVFFGEDDLFLSPDHIENLHKERIRTGADIICGNLIQQDFGESFDESYKRVSTSRVSVFNNRLIAVNYGAIKEPMELPFAHAIFMAPRGILKKYMFSTRVGGPSFMREDIELQLTLRAAGYRLFATPNAIAYHYPRNLSYGAGTRLNQPIIISAASAAINTWQVVNQHYEEIVPFFPSLSKKQMLRKSVFWTFLLEIKRRIQVKYILINKLIYKLRNLSIL